MQICRYTKSVGLYYILEFYYTYNYNSQMHIPHSDRMVSSKTTINNNTQEMSVDIFMYLWIT
jgi:hypothetical protein